MFRGLAFLGPDSDKALRAALAAAEQDGLWNVVHGLFTSQGAENSGWVTDGLLRSLGREAGIDADRMLAQTHSPAVERELAAAQAAAKRAGVPGTPFFQAGPTGGGARAAAREQPRRRRLPGRARPPPAGVSDRLCGRRSRGFSLAGVAVTAYLLSVRWGSVQLYCSTGGCETVQSSSYAEILGVPVAAAGLLAYLALGASAFSSAPLVRVGAAALALASVAFSAYLLVVQLVVIDAVCTWCVVSDVLVCPRRRRRGAPPPGAARGSAPRLRVEQPGRERVADELRAARRDGASA